METKEVSTQTAVEEATVFSEQIKAQISGMDKKEVSTQTAEGATADSTQAIKAQISDVPTATVTTAEDGSDQHAKNSTAKKKDSFKRSKTTADKLAMERAAHEKDDPQTNYSLNKAEGCDDSSDSNKSTVNHGFSVSVEEEKDNTEMSSAWSKTAGDENDTVNRDPADEKDNREVNSARRKTADDNKGAEPDRDYDKQNVDTFSIQPLIDSNTCEDETEGAKRAFQNSGMVEDENAADITERYASSTSNDETDRCSSLSSAAFNLESKLQDYSPETRNAIEEAARLPGAVHTPDRKLKHQFLSPDETQALIQLQNEIGKFSFYICGDGRVIIHPEDTVALNNSGLLKYRFLEIVGVSRRDFEIILKGSSFKGKFCTHRIGAKLVADGSQTTAGMYVSHNGVLYLISSAHNYVFSESGYDGSEKKEILLLDEGRSFIDVAGEKVPIRPLYCVFSKMCDLKEKGRRIMHLVDISIGLAPVCTSRMESGRAQFCASIEEGQDYCRDCDETIEDCNDSRHRKDSNPCQFKIARFYDFGMPMGCGEDNSEEQLRRYYDAKLLNEGGALVRCRPCDRSVVAGRVLSFDNAVTLRIDEQRAITATNVLLITPVKRSVTPQLGDSGSVWVLDGTNDAVAINVGLGEGPDGGLLWAAAPLQPLLEALCCAFSKVFPDVSTIKPASHGVALPSTTQGSQVAAMATPLSAPSTTTSLVGIATEGDQGYVTAPSNPES